MKVPPEPAPCKMVNRKAKITMTPGRAKRQPPHTEPHIIPDDTEIIPQIPHPYDGSLCNIPLIQKYNISSRRLKVHNLMANLVETFPPPRQPPTSLLAYKVHRKGEDWAHTNKTTGEVKIQTLQTNANIFLETGKSQEYRHLIKGPGKLKWTRAM